MILIWDRLQKVTHVDPLPNPTIFPYWYCKWVVFKLFLTDVKLFLLCFYYKKKNCDIDLGYKIEIFIGKIYVVNGTWPVYSYWPLFNSFLVSPQKGWLLVQKKRLKRMVGPWGKCITISWGKPIVLGRKGKTGRRGLYILLNP